MTALEMKQPGVIFRGTILVAQGKTISAMYSHIKLWLISTQATNRSQDLVS